MINIIRLYGQDRAINYKSDFEIKRLGITSCYLKIKSSFKSALGFAFQS